MLRGVGHCVDLPCSVFGMSVQLQRMIIRRRRFISDVISSQTKIDLFPRSERHAKKVSSSKEARLQMREGPSFAVILIAIENQPLAYNRFMARLERLPIQFASRVRDRIQIHETRASPYVLASNGSHDLKYHTQKLGQRLGGILYVIIFFYYILGQLIIIIIALHHQNHQHSRPF